LEPRTQTIEHAVSEDSVQQMLLLAERLRMSSGGDLDDQAILAVSEATGIPVEYVRVSVSRMPETKANRGIFTQLRHAVLSLEPAVRSHVISGVLATNLALLNVLAVRFGDQYGFFGTLGLILTGLGLYNLALCRESRTAVISGALLGGIFFFSRSLFSLIARTPDTFPAFVLLPHILVGGIAGFALQTVWSRVRTQVGAKDPLQERQELLQQLVSLQDKLRSGEQSMTFLSLDIVGSTRMKEHADPLSVEYTFTEYHKWVDWVARRFQGQVHSTAGDGITCAFSHPQHAFAAAKYIQTGLVELNTFRNKIGVPIQLRAGIHHGTVNAPAGQDVTKINFSHVIDVAAHMQKVAPIGGIAVSEAAAQHVTGGPAMIGREQIEVSNVRGVIWIPKTAVSTPSSEGPPPLPA
jgi:class 3 adenylate cyclase